MADYCDTLAASQAARERDAIPIPPKGCRRVSGGDRLLSLTFPP